MGVQIKQDLARLLTRWPAVFRRRPRITEDADLAVSVGIDPPPAGGTLADWTAHILGKCISKPSLRTPPIWNMTMEADAVEYTATDAEVGRQIGEEIIKRRPLWLTTEEVEDAASNGTMAKTGRRPTIIATGSVITSPSSNDIEQWGGRTKPDPSKGRRMVRILDVKAPAATLRYSAR